MSTFYDRIMATADRLIDEYGREVSLISVSNAGSNYSPKLVPGEPVAAKALFASDKVGRNDALIKLNQKECLVVAPAKIYCDDIDEIMDNGKRLTVVGYDIIAPGEEKILLKFRIQK